MKPKKIMIVEWEQKYDGWQQWAEQYFEHLVAQSGYVDAQHVINYIKGL